jgi:hypothetical protein
MPVAADVILANQTSSGKRGLSSPNFALNSAVALVLAFTLLPFIYIALRAF